MSQGKHSKMIQKIVYTTYTKMTDLKAYVPAVATSFVKVWQDFASAQVQVNLPSHAVVTFLLSFN